MKAAPKFLAFSEGPSESLSARPIHLLRLEPSAAGKLALESSGTTATRALARQHVGFPGAAEHSSADAPVVQPVVQLPLERDLCAGRKTPAMAVRPGTRHPL